MWAQIADAMHRLEEDPVSLAEPNNQATQLKEKERQLAKIMEDEMTHQQQVLVLSCMHLQQAEEVKAQSQEIR